MVEAEDEHYISFLSCTYNHISEEAFVLTDIEECQAVLKSVILDEKTDSI